jgi:ABC-type bacteriocin/lantibiotic exporter with double-glycine peptidase domain
VVAVLVAFAGCISYSGGSRTVDPARLTQPGWIVAAETPELRQQGSRDCGAAALAMIAGRWHVPLSVDGAVAALPAPPPQGTQLGDLRDAARAQGLTAFAITGDRTTLVHELRAGRPVIVGLLLPYGRKRVQSHYEVIVAVHPTEDQFVTINPAKGWRIRSWAALDAEWRPARRPTLVVLGPTSKPSVDASANNRRTTAAHVLHASSR